MERPVVLFDGVCNFCNAGVDFIIDNDTKKIFRFAALQSKAGQDVLKKFNFSATDFDTMIFVESGKIYTKSTAVLRIMRLLRKPLPFLSVLLLVPSFLRDSMYGTISKNRYKWFGKRASCRVPTTELKERFLD